MNAVIYLDQNTLSDLRERRLVANQGENMRLLKHVLISNSVQVIYSHVNLSEINQISVDKYKVEHIHLLNELHAKYIEPLSKLHDEREPFQVWSDYLQNEIDNVNTGISSLAEVSELSTRKLSGLPIELSFDEINTKLKDSLKSMLDSCAEELDGIDIDELEEPIRSYFINVKSQLPELLAESQQMESLPVADNQELGPRVFRGCSELQKANFENLPSNEVVDAIEAIFEVENEGFNWSDYFEESPQNRVARAYNLMNWAGYYADDFDKVKKNNDRFRASNNDMQHTVMGLGASFLISSDNNMLMKAKASYKYVGSPTIACSPNEFLKDYCVFK